MFLAIGLVESDWLFQSSSHDTGMMMIHCRHMRRAVLNLHIHLPVPEVPQGTRAVVAFLEPQSSGCPCSLCPPGNGMALDLPFVGHKLSKHFWPRLIVSRNCKTDGEYSPLVAFSLTINVPDL